MFNPLRLLTSFQSPLVVRQIKISGKSEIDPKSMVYISARKSGIIAFILAKLGISSLYELKVNRKEIQYKESSIFGITNQTIPINNSVTNIICGLNLPIHHIIFAILSLLFGLYYGFVKNDFIVFFTFLLVSIVFIGLYLLGKRVFLEIYPGAGPPIIMALKPSIIRGMPIDKDKLLLIAALIRDLVYNVNMGASSDNQEVISVVQAEAVTGYEVIQPETEAASYESYSPAPEVSEPTNPFAWDAYQSQPAPSAYNSPPAAAQETPEQAAERLLAEARALKQANRRQEVIERLRQIVHYYPQTQAAQKARQILEKAGISA
jgi:hypothetical protein